MSSPVAVVTGASRGIGKQLCVDLAKAGYHIVAVARSTAERPTKLPGTVDDTAQLVRSVGRSCMTAGVDVTDETAVSALADRVFQEFGRCDLLVNNAGIAPEGPSMSASTKRWRLVMDVNVHGPFYFMYYFHSRMAEASGRIVNVSSSAPLEFGRPSYTTTKRALDAMSQTLALELAGKVAINVVQVEVRIWSEGFAVTLPGQDLSDFEHPAIMSDAVLWLSRQPIEYTGHVLRIEDLRAAGAVRPSQPISAIWAAETAAGT